MNDFNINDETELLKYTGLDYPTLLKLASRELQIYTNDDIYYFSHFDLKKTYDGFTVKMCLTDGIDEDKSIIIRDTIGEEGRNSAYNKDKIDAEIGTYMDEHRNKYYVRDYRYRTWWFYDEYKQALLDAFTNYRKENKDKLASQITK